MLFRAQPETKGGVFLERLRERIRASVAGRAPQSKTLSGEVVPERTGLPATPAPVHP
jgi:hypothetical protein